MTKLDFNSSTYTLMILTGHGADSEVEERGQNYKSFCFVTASMVDISSAITQKKTVI